MNPMRRWPYTFAVVLSVAVAILTVVMSQRLNLPIRDPDGFLGPSYVRLPLIVVLFFAAGIIPTALWRGRLVGFPQAVTKIIREEWSVKRVTYILVGLGAFYTCYVGYRNIKSYLPVVRKDVRFDYQMLELDHYLMFGHNPAELLHNLLGTGFSAQILAFAYVAYLMLIPLTLGAFLVWGRDLSLGAWYATTLSLNWIMGAASYYILPTLGPAFQQPQSFLELPKTSASALQDSLSNSGWMFKEDPGSNHIYGIAGFASLHVSVVLAACLFFSRVRLNAIIRWSAWFYFVLVVIATIYFGWHYLADDVAGAFIGWSSVVIGQWVSGNRGRNRRGPLEGSLVRSDLDESPAEPEPAA